MRTWPAFLCVWIMFSEDTTAYGSSEPSSSLFLFLFFGFLYGHDTPMFCLFLCFPTHLHRHRLYGWLGQASCGKVLIEGGYRERVFSVVVSALASLLLFCYWWDHHGIIRTVVDSSQVWESYFITDNTVSSSKNPYCASCREW